MQFEYTRAIVIDATHSVRGEYNLYNYVIRVVYNNISL